MGRKAMVVTLVVLLLVACGDALRAAALIESLPSSALPVRIAQQQPAAPKAGDVPRQIPEGTFDMSYAR